MESGVYGIRCVVTDQHYVGCSLSWQARISQHIRRLNRGKHSNPKLQKAWIEYGAASFEFKLLEACEKEDLLETEIFWCRKLHTLTHGFNNIKFLGFSGRLLHGQTHTGAHKSWESMLQRCTNPKNPDYQKYHGAGVRVCDRWLSFENFYADMGDRPEGTSLDRFPDKNGMYEPGNCRWATPTEQQRNLRSNLFATINGEERLAIEWAEELGIPKGVLRRRIKKGLTGEALLAPTYSSFSGVASVDGKMPKRVHNYTHAKKYTAFGKTLTIDEWSKETGISRTNLAQRIQKYKMPLEKALSVGPLKKGKVGPRDGKNLITAFGKTQSITAWARETGLPVSTIRNRLFRAKLDPEFALKRE